MNYNKALTQKLTYQLLHETNGTVKKALRIEIEKELKGLGEFTTMGKAKRLTGNSYIGSVNSSAKIIKNAKLNYDTYIVYLAPYKMSGYNTCSKASEGCIKACLNTSGRVKMDIKEDKILTARLFRTLLFYANREYFMKWAFAEIESAEKKAKKKGHDFSIRLNGTSDLSLDLFKVGNVKVLDKFPNVQFYDYTKVYRRLNDFKDNKNYHLTFSYSGENDQEVFNALEEGFNVAVPFLKNKNESLPIEFLGYKVGDADETDLRFLDKERIAGLRVKKLRDRTAVNIAVVKGFVIDNDNFTVEDLRLEKIKVA